MKGRKPKEKTAQPISFRLDPDYLERLEGKAKRNKMSAGEFARKLVMDSLDDTKTERLEAELVSLQSQFFEMRRDLALSVQAILVGAGKTSKDEAKKWTAENLVIGQ